MLFTNGSNKTALSAFPAPITIAILNKITNIEYKTPGQGFNNC